METALDIFERLTGINVDELFAESENRRSAAERALRAKNLPDVAEAIAEHQKLIKAPVYAAGELVPRLYPIQQMEPVGPILDPPIINAGNLWPALMYAHRVEVPNPLYKSGWSNASHNERSFFNLMCALGAWRVIDPLVKAGIVTIGLEPAQGFRPADYVRTAVRTARGRKALMELLPILQLKENEFVGSDEDPPELIDSYIRMFESAVTNDIYEAVHTSTLSLILSAQATAMSRSYADIWLPSPPYLDLIASVREARVGRNEKVLTWLNSLSVVDFAQLNTRDVVSIRLNSDAFNDWREALQATYRQLEIKAETGTLDDVSTSAAEFLNGQVEHLRAKLRRDLRKLLPGAARSLVVGLAAAIPGIAISDSVQASSFAGGAVGLAAGAAWDFIGSSPNRRASRAIVRHATTLTPGILAED
jgi:hypothetical protein